MVGQNNSQEIEIICIRKQKGCVVEVRGRVKRLIGKKTIVITPSTHGTYYFVLNGKKLSIVNNPSTEPISLRVVDTGLRNTLLNFPECTN